MASYGINYPRLQSAKRQPDPDNLFRTNLNIEPTSPGAQQRSSMGSPATLSEPAR